MYDDDEEDAEDLPLAEELDLAEEWQEYYGGRFPTASTRRGFLLHLREKVSNPDAIDGIGFCGSCGQPEWVDELQRTGTGEDICESCWDEWMDCDRCGERFPDGDLYSTLSDTLICETCRDRHYSYCEYCDGYYPDDESSEHGHDGSGCCDPVQVEFAIRNDGCDPLKNDTRVTVELPSGVISAEGLTDIWRELRYGGYYLSPGEKESLGDAWQATDGNFTKRLSRLMYKNYQAKLSPELLSRIGCIARDHSNATATVIDVTRQLNLPASEFYNEDSCWWGSYSESRCALKTSGGLAMRSWGQYGHITGRAWVMPLKLDERGQLVPTFETLNPAAFVVFNGYGKLSGYAPARILAHMAGMTYRKTGFQCTYMYVNSGGYLVAPEDIARQYEHRALILSVSQHSDLWLREQREKEAQLAFA